VLHARYSRQEVVAALGFGDGVKPKMTREGILWVPEARSDVFFVDLHKAERDYFANDDVPRLRDQPRALPLGIPVSADPATTDGSAIHQPSIARHADPSVRTRT
jgi:hypothetical protein